MIGSKGFSVAQGDRMLAIIFLIFLGMFAISGILISIEAKQRRDRNSPDRN
jgi:hypothetical protein